ncbi:hypothetical protein [Novosphingobium sp.]|uniref:hypothetical protein n=1 Tax=Novosphingobium sp. TaxID=1874826 RepID=UPI0035244952
MHLIEANWVAFALALLIGLAVAWWLFGRASTTPKRDRRPDVLDEGAPPAQRNQALIDAPPAAQIVPPAFGGIMGGIAEAIAIGAQDVVEEAAAAAAAEAAPAPAAGDDLSKIKGLGPKLQALLPTLGISTYAQIAALTEADLADLDTRLGAFAGRPKRDNWIDQARHLAAGDIAGFEAQFGKL